MESKFIKVQAEETLIGGVIGLGIGLAAVAPLTAGLHSVNPVTAPGLTGFLQASLLVVSGALCAAIGMWLTARQERDSHLDGARYIPEFGVAKRQLVALEAAQFSKAQRERRVQGVNIGGVELSRGTETGHIYAVGLPRSGKTVLLTSLIDQVIGRGDRCVIHDPKGDFTARYFDPATCVLVGPWDVRAAVWDASTDIDSPALADEFAASVAGKIDGQNKFFHDAAGRLLAGIIRARMRDGSGWTWASLRSTLDLPPIDLIHQAAIGDAGIMSVMPSAFAKGQELTAGERSVLSVLGTATGWLSNYAAVVAAAPDKPLFSIRRWLMGESDFDKKIVILNNNALYETAGEAIFGTALATVSAACASAVMPERGADEPGGLWCILDEFPQLGATALGQIQRLAEIGRSRGVRVVTALQDETQLAAKVGREKAAPMLAVQSTRIYTACSDMTAESVSRRIGERKIHRLETVTENGQFAGKTKRLVTERAILAADLMGLAVRTSEAPIGVELIMHSKKVMGRLVQPFPARNEHPAEPLLESQAWRMGGLNPIVPDRAASQPPAIQEPPEVTESSPAGILDGTLEEIANGASPSADDIDSILGL